MRTGNRLLNLFAVALFLAVPYLTGQEVTAGLQGTVTDPSGAAIRGASVEISGEGLPARKTVTDEVGVYRFPALPQGNYSVTVTATGFQTQKLEGIQLSVGRLPSLDVHLAVGGVATTIEVTTGAPLVDVTQSKVAVPVPQEILQEIPTGRSFQSVIPFAPGARQEPLQGGRDNRSNGFQVDGATDAENVYMIDGISAINISTGGTGKDFQMDFLPEVQIKSSSFEAEYGGAMGGVVNAVPKRGGNDWHGSLLT